VVAPRLAQVKGGYAGVTMDGLGAAAGISGASAYTYFDSKAQLFEMAVARAVSWGLARLEQAWAASTSPLDLLERAIAGQAELAVAFPELGRSVVNDVVDLPDPHRSAVLAHATGYLEQWRRCLRAARPDLADEDAAVLVHAVLTVMGELSRVPPGGAPPAAADVAAVALRMVDTH